MCCWRRVAARILVRHAQPVAGQDAVRDFVRRSRGSSLPAVVRRRIVAGQSAPRPDNAGDELAGHRLGGAARWQDRRDRYVSAPVSEFVTSAVLLAGRRRTAGTAATATTAPTGAAAATPASAFTAASRTPRSESEPLPRTGRHGPPNAWQQLEVIGALSRRTGIYRRGAEDTRAVRPMIAR